MKKESYRCLTCFSELKLDSKITLIVRNQKKGKGSLILFNDFVDDAEAVLDPNFPLFQSFEQKNSNFDWFYPVFELFCPVCGDSLKSRKKEGFYNILVKEGILFFKPKKEFKQIPSENGFQENRVLFSFESHLEKYEYVFISRDDDFVRGVENDDYFSGGMIM